jgi:hypothetical protein
MQCSPVLVPGTQTLLKRAEVASSSFMVHPALARLTRLVSRRILCFHKVTSVDLLIDLECVAEDAKRPLISLTGSHIGTEPELVEKRLLYWFNLAKVWGAVLLIDEADMFLEGGPGSDLHRNLVAIFLRTLEYHQGLLFLTTNRVGVFDDTVTSRIHVLLYLPALDFESRVRLWEMSFRRLTEERQGKIKVTRSARNYIRKGRDPLDQNWNGREIRNGECLLLREFTGCLAVY